MDWSAVAAIAALPGIVLFAAVIAIVGNWSHQRDQKRLDDYHLQQYRIEQEVAKATVDCEELWTQWDWERERGLR